MNVEHTLLEKIDRNIDIFRLAFVGRCVFSCERARRFRNILCINDRFCSEASTLSCACVISAQMGTQW
jgi:hypothetical protein